MMAGSVKKKLEPKSCNHCGEPVPRTVLVRHNSRPTKNIYCSKGCADKAKIKPPIPQDIVEQVLKLKSEGASVRKTVETLRIPQYQVQKIRKENPMVKKPRSSALIEAQSLIGQTKNGIKITGIVSGDTKTTITLSAICLGEKIRYRRGGNHLYYTCEEKFTIQYKTFLKAVKEKRVCSCGCQNKGRLESRNEIEKHPERWR